MDRNENTIRDLKELADFTYQKQIWLGLDRPTGFRKESSIAEAGCRLFVDSGLGYALASEKTVYSPAVDNDLRRLRRMVEELYYTVDSIDALRSEAMDNVRSLAQQILLSIDPKRKESQSP